MGYDLHITRAEFWAQNEGKEISNDEWLRLVEQDPELDIDAQNGPHFAAWRKASDKDGWSKWFDWSEGNVYTKNPDKAVLEKLLQLAERLDAKVQGDDGELYNSADELTEPAGSDGVAPVRRNWIRANIEYIVVAIAVLAWILFDLYRG